MSLPPPTSPLPSPTHPPAGITCGYLGIPFATFFGATLLGKAVIKVSLQVVFIIAVVRYGTAALAAGRAAAHAHFPSAGRLHSLLDSVRVRATSD